MSPGESELRRAQAAAERARRLLIFPSAANLESSRPLLEQACGGLQSVRQALAQGPPGRKQELRAGVEALAITVRRTAALLKGAASFRAGWFEALAAAATVGYNSQGEPARQTEPRTLSVEG